MAVDRNDDVAGSDPLVVCRTVFVHGVDRYLTMFPQKMQTAHIFLVRDGKLVAGLQVEFLAGKIERDLVPSKEAKAEVGKIVGISNERGVQVGVIKTLDGEPPNLRNLALSDLIAHSGDGGSDFACPVC